MKTYKFKYFSLFFISLLFIFNSCSKWTNDEINIDPDAPSDVPMNLLLPAIQQAVGYTLMGNNSVRTTSIWMQQFDGVDRQSYTEARYQLTPADVNNFWQSAYTEILMNSKILIEKSSVSGKESPAFTGVAKILTAVALGNMTDLFGDMPYSDALQGQNNILQPKYDNQQQIYSTIQSLLSEAIVNLNATSNVYALDGDVCYANNKAKWIKAAYALKARYALQLSKINGNNAYTEALSYINKAFTSNTDDLMVPWESANHNPLFQFMEQRGDIRMGSTLVNMLLSNNDPRLSYYASLNDSGVYEGSIPGSENTSASKPGVYVAGDVSPTQIISYSEVLFIKAEALYVTKGASAAQSTYEAAVAASVLKVTNNSNASWLSANINGDPVTLEKIIKQKYIATFGTNQPFADYRRTSFPNLQLAIGALTTTIPNRFPYPQAELDYNSANVPSVVITDKVWWDQ